MNNINKIIKVHMHLFFYLDVPNDFLLVFSSIKYEEETVIATVIGINEVALFKACMEFHLKLDKTLENAA